MSNSSKTKKTANNILTHKHTNTLTHYDINILDLHDKSGGVAPPLPLGLDGLGGVEGEVTPALDNSKIAYINATLKTPKLDSPERRDLNVDFQLIDSVHYNKLVFDLVASSRRREFLANIKEQYRDWTPYQICSEATKGQFVGKGRKRLVAEKNKQKRSNIQLYTAAKLWPDNSVTIWIENACFDIQLDPFEDAQGLFCAKGWYQNVKQQKYDIGGWR